MLDLVKVILIFAYVIGFFVFALSIAFAGIKYRRRVLANPNEEVKPVGPLENLLASNTRMSIARERAMLLALLVGAVFLLLSKYLNEFYAYVIAVAVFILGVRKIKKVTDDDAEQSYKKNLKQMQSLWWNAFNILMVLFIIFLNVYFAIKVFKPEIIDGLISWFRSLL